MGMIFKGVWSLLLASAVLWLLPTIAHPQAPHFTLNQLDEAHLDSLAMLTANKIHEVKLEEEPRVLVVDFFRDSTGESSELGTLLAGRFSESLTAYSSGIHILDRKVLKDYLFENWTVLERNLLSGRSSARGHRSDFGNAHGKEWQRQSRSSS